MKIPYYHVDAFTNKRFSGNPAGVCLLADWASDDVLQNIANENNLAETAFVIQRQSQFDLRWFSPTTEIDLCGHATLASAHVLFQHLGYQPDTITFETRSGKLKVTRASDLLTLDFPSRPATGCAPPTDLIQALGRTPVHTGKARDYLAVLDSEKAVRELQPDLNAVSRLDCLGVIVTAPGDHCDFVSRFFAPSIGVPEDPVTGSAHCTLIPYWAERLGRSRMHARQLSRRGGELFCELHGGRVGIGGHAVTYHAGFIELT
ncbi:MAG TPA: PhzF family phenazine biosynthesis protein [Verrucomicrobiae bacterium]|nr:PhzF family phenazine biosynthesis protein [Verrucomicrobiae bacterium]